VKAVTGAGARAGTGADAGAGASVGAGTVKEKFEGPGL
jgi:hypothetical protein